MQLNCLPSQIRHSGSSEHPQSRKGSLLNETPCNQRSIQRGHMTVCIKGRKQWNEMAVSYDDEESVKQ